MADVDVLIVGGGPTGTSLALELAVQGVSFRIIDKDAVRSDKSRAIALQPRSIELLNRHGMGRDLVDRGRYVRGMQVYVHQRAAATIDLDNLGVAADTQFPLPLMVPQNGIEAVLDDVLARHGRTVERPVVATVVAQDADGVTTTLARGPDGSGPEETVRSRYVVGCDGAHSTVRRAAAGLRFDGAAYTQEFMLCDARLRGGADPPAGDRLVMCLGSGMLGMFPLSDGVVRLIAPTDAGADNDDDGSGNKGDPTAEDFQAALDRVGPPGCGAVDETIWLARFRLHHRGVNAYRDGRLFVAGDAAHIHSPVGGQGMNTGIQDAINLGWKLGAVLRGEAPASLLDTYDAERRPVGKALLRGTDRVFGLIVTANPILAGLRNALLPWVLPWVARWRSWRASAFQFISELGINYRGSPVVGAGAGFPSCYWSDAIVGGDRLSDGSLRYCPPGGAAGEGGKASTLQELCVGPGHHLLLFASEASSTTEEVLSQAINQVAALVRGQFETHFLYIGEGPTTGAENRGGHTYADPEGKLHQRYGFAKQPGYVFVRPDGYIAHIGLLTRLDGLLAFLKRPGICPDPSP